MFAFYVLKIFYAIQMDGKVSHEKQNKNNFQQLRNFFQSSSSHRLDSEARRRRKVP